MLKASWEHIKALMVIPAFVPDPVSNLHVASCLQTVNWKKPVLRRLCGNLVTRRIVKDENGKKHTQYLHRPGWNTSDMSNHARIVFGRQQRIPNYMANLAD